MNGISLEAQSLQKSECVCMLGSPWLSGFPLLLRPTVGAVLSCISALLQLQLPQICCDISWP